MQLLLAEIKGLTRALAGLRSDNIVVDNLDRILAQLKASDMQHQMEQNKATLPSAPEEEKALEKHKERLKGQADVLNKEAGKFLDELERIKTMRHTLNLEALDPIIKEARKIIQAIHGFTAGLQD
jgi:hypothetical protein